MSDLQDTKDLSEKWCPTCQPDRDPSREILQVEYCSIHTPARDGADDSGVTGNSSFGTHYGAMDSDGATNKLVSDLLKKGKKKK
jgi:hypothetical protein